MRIALVTTTINVPKVLAAYRKLGPDVLIFVTGDQKTPATARELCDSMAFVHFDDVDRISELDYAHVKYIGWNTDSLRNVAVLEALKWGAEIVVSIDDDMIPLSHDFFEQIERTLTQPFSGLVVGSPDYWCDVGFATMPPARQRGLPTDAPYAGGAAFAHDVQVGAMQGIILGVPDTDASTTVANRPIIGSATDILKHGFVVDLQAKSVFNSQITAFRRELAPAFAQFYFAQGRNTDIFASLIMRRVMRDRALYTYFGPPAGFHARAPRDPLKDMKAEMWGMENIAAFSNELDDLAFPAGSDSVIEQVRWIYQSEVLAGSCEAGMAWLEDCEKVL